MIRAAAPSRLHFGLFNPGPADPWPNLDGEPTVPGRRFGGVGLMVRDPGLQVAVEPAAEWTATGPLAGRALEFARRFADTVPGLPPQRLIVEWAAPEHVGLGTGTQLGLAVAQVLAVAAGYPDWGPVELAGRVGRGERSAIGVHGFAGGGFLVDGGKRGGGVAPLLLRERFPDEWRVVLVLPTAGSGLHGTVERRAFEKLLGEPRPGLAETLCRLTLLGMLPALREGDCRGFGEALYDFNARVGEAFAAAQGGRYAGPLVGAVVREARRLGLAGAGQSSWGPAAFTVAESESRAAVVAARLQDHFGAAVTVSVTAAFNGR